MKFECGDLDRALANPDLMPEARQHLQICAKCRNEYWLWNEISTAAKELHHEWDSPDLWPRIQNTLEAEQRASKKGWLSNGGTRATLWGCAAAAAIFVVLLVVRWPQHGAAPVPNNPLQSTMSSGRDFLTVQALKQVETNEAAYRRSIDELTRLVQPKLESRALSPVAGSYREQLLMLDSAIAETRSHIAENQFNVQLQTELAGLYREKRQTLQEILSSGQRN